MPLVVRSGAVAVLTIYFIGRGRLLMIFCGCLSPCPLQRAVRTWDLGCITLPHVRPQISAVLHGDVRVEACFMRLAVFAAPLALAPHRPSSGAHAPHSWRQPRPAPSAKSQKKIKRINLMSPNVDSSQLLAAARRLGIRGTSVRRAQKARSCHG